MFCTNCGKEINSGSFCSNCGAPVQGTTATATVVSVQSNTDTEQAFLATTKKLLHWERNLWKIGGIITTICGGFLCFIFLMILLGGHSPTGPEGNELDSFSFFVIMIYFFYGTIFLAIGIVNLVTVSKITPHLNNMEKNFAPTAKRLDSVGRIVYTVFFNGYALIFYIINFVRMKNNKATVESIIAKQQNQ
jgi:hypothetical protein